MNVRSGSDIITAANTRRERQTSTSNMSYPTRLVIFYFILRMGKHGGNQWGRPPSINEARLNAAEKILDDKDELNTIIYTDEEMVAMINDEVKENERIWYGTFREYKAGKQLEDEGAREFIERFSALYIRILRKQKRSLFNQLKKDKTGRQRFSWIIERKFNDRNLRIQQDNNNKNSWEVKLTIDYSD